MHPSKPDRKTSRVWMNTTGRITPRWMNTAMKIMTTNKLFYTRSMTIRKNWRCSTGFVKCWKLRFSDVWILSMMAKTNRRYSISASVTLRNVRVCCLWSMTGEHRSAGFFTIMTKALDLMRHQPDWSKVKLPPNGSTKWKMERWSMHSKAIPRSMMIF